MKSSEILNRDNLKYKVMKDMFIFLSQSKYFKDINFKNLNKISRSNRLKCLHLSKQISNFMCINNLFLLDNSSLTKILLKNFKDKDLKIYLKNIELIKFYTILFMEKTCSHLTFYLFNNLKNNFEDEEFLSIVIIKNQKYCVILNENLDIFMRKLRNIQKGEPFLYKDKIPLYSKLKQRIALFVFTIIVGWILTYNIPTNHIILEMNLTMHMKTNHVGHIISYKAKSTSAKNMLRNTKNRNSKINSTILKFIDYGLENNILKPGQNVKIYILGPPFKDKIFDNLKSYLRDIPLDILINNSGNLIKINRTY